MTEAAPRPGRRKKRRRREKSVLRKRLEYFVVRMIASRIESADETTVRRWGGRMGTVASILLRQRRRLVFRNLEQTFPDLPESERNRIAKECWKHYGRLILDYLKTRKMTLEETAHRFDLINREGFEQAISRGKGVLLLSAHFGNWETGATLLRMFGQPITTVARPLDNEFLERDLAQSRLQSGVELVPRREAARPLMRALANRRIVVLLADQSVHPSEGIVVPFLGRPAWTTPAPARFALRFGAPIQLVFCLPSGVDHTIIEFEETIYVDQLPEEERTVAAITERINDLISVHIRRNPEYWLWMHDRWKGSPEKSVKDEEELRGPA